MFQQLSFDVVCQVEDWDLVGGGGGGAAARDKSKNLLCGSECVGCGVVAGVLLLHYSASCVEASDRDTFSVYSSSVWMDTGLFKGTGLTLL